MEEDEAISKDETVEIDAAIGPMMAMAAPRAKAQMDTSVSPGENTVSASVDVVFELGK